jgi:hypothetical protein
MPPIFRSIVAIVLGVILAMTLVMISDTSCGVLFLPEGIDHNDMEAIKAAIPGMPMPAFVMLVAGWSFAAFAGGWVSGWLAGRAPLIHAGIIGALVTLGTILNLRQLEHPQWVNIIAPILPIPASLLAALLVPRRKTQPAAGEP